MKEIRKIQDDYDYGFVMLLRDENIRGEAFAKACEDLDNTKMNNIKNACEKYGIDELDLPDNYFLNYKDLNSGWYLYEEPWTGKY